MGGWDRGGGDDIECSGRYLSRAHSFQDGKLRVFHNDLDNQGCCYYFGLRHYDDGTQGRTGVQRPLLAFLDSEDC